MVRDSIEGHGNWQAHTTAEIEPGAVIGEETIIWHYCHVRAGARMGQGCSLGRNVYVDEGAILGDRVRVQNNVSIYNGVVLDDDVFVGPSAVFTNDRYPRVKSIRRTWNLETTRVRKGASIGAGAVILAGVDIGEYAMIAAGAVVSKDVPAYALIRGSAGRLVAWVDEQGDVVKRLTGMNK